MGIHTRGDIRFAFGEYYMRIADLKIGNVYGEDTIENTVALCPNCHRKMHVINDSDEVKTLQSALVYYKRKGL